MVARVVLLVHGCFKVLLNDVLIHTDNLSKSYGTGDQIVHALDHVSLDIDTQDFVAIVGASGSGKSTFMNLIGCLDQATSGSYYLAGENVEAMDADALADVRSRRIGFVFQQFNLLARTSAVDNVALPLLYARNGPLAHLDHQARIDHAKVRLEQVGLGKRFTHTPAELSGGQQQRVAIARALVNDPLLILADEPTGALDSKTSVEVLELLTRLNQQGMTVIVVTHSLEVAAYAKREITFRDGQIVNIRVN